MSWKADVKSNREVAPNQKVKSTRSVYGVPVK